MPYKRVAEIRGIAKRLDTHINALSLTEKAWLVLERKYAGSERYTLTYIAEELGLSKERVRQIQSKAIERISERLSVIIPVLNLLEEQADVFSLIFDKEASIESAISACCSLIAMATSWEEPPHELEVKRLTLAIRALCDEGNKQLEALYPEISYAICSLPPPILGHTKVNKEVAQIQKEYRDQHRRWGYEELAEAVLKEAGVPLHWSEIAERAERLGHRPDFSPTSLHNLLSGAHERFARVGQGTYGLTEWGIETVDFYPDIIADVLKSANKTLSYGEILRRVTAIRPVKEGSLQMILDLHSRFYRSHEGSYGLRAWLPPREKQTLRTPKCLIEPLDSFQRVSREKAKGVDVDRMVEQDKSSHQL